MLKKIITLLFPILITSVPYAQDSIRYRMIFIGDAGEINPQQKTVLSDAANHIIKNKTSVMYLGDNIYPRGMGLPGSKEEVETKQILQSQFKPMRQNGAPVYFIPGNHDWDKMGPKGLAKIKTQWQYLEEQHDTLLKMLPPNGCSGPVEINVSDSLVIIAFDSEWWLYPYNKSNPDADCDCNNKKEILEKFSELLYKNRYKVILLASHHPFQSYGTHGGYYSLKDNLFPLTVLNKNLYIPLPIIGSLYPLLRSTFANPEDLKHPLYKSMETQIDAVFEGFPNLVHVAGHEHGLQFIKNKQTQVVSGAGAKNTYVKKGKDAMFANAKQGYVTADLLTGNTMRFTYYVYSDTGFSAAFVYNQAYTPIKPKEDSVHYASIKTDSVLMKVHPAYDKVSKLHRKLFGENYRKEWALETKLPVIRISEIQGGLTPLQRGGGQQSTSLRLVDKSGKEWVIRSVEKNPDPILPEELRGTIAREFLDDETSSQHPFSALIVPPLANAAKVRHANPVIGLMAPDTAFGVYERLFANTVCLLEEREPGGESDNTPKMIKTINKDNDNGFDGKGFLRARLLDLFIGDWDRHEDQWRWLNVSKKKKDKQFEAVPRDRDQVFHLTEGFVPNFTAKSYILPTFQGFGGKIKHVDYSLFKTNFLNAYPDVQFSYKEWMKITDDFIAAMTDSVLEASLQKLPTSSYNLRHKQLLAQLKERRGNIHKAMDEFYRFVNKIVDIKLSNKNELIEITDTANNALNIKVNKINKDGIIKDEIMNKTYDPLITKEIRIYVSNGDDSVVINNKNSNIKLRLISGDGDKVYNVTSSKNTIKYYGKENGIVFKDTANKLQKHIDKDSANTAFTPVNLYNVTMPLTNIGINPDDGLLLGLGFKHIQQEGFRKKPFSNEQQVMVMHSFSTKAFSIDYKGEWTEVIGKANFVVHAVAKAPDNSLNFFGRGNETPFNKIGNYKRYYRARFNIYELDPALRWGNLKGTSLAIGPAIQYYKFDADDNNGRFINNVSLIHSYDSATVSQNKIHAGIAVNFISDKRNNPILTTYGSYINIKLNGYAGLNNYSKSYGQIIPEVTIYKSLDKRSNIVLAERIGCGITVGKTTFYQSLFLGGNGNLLGYRQNRFAGQYSFYNNLELRVKLADVGSYILPGQLGLIGYYDIGRVWENDEQSNKWHNGVGGGIYFAPARMVVVKFVMGNSTEGWYPYVALGMRF